METPPKAPPLMKPAAELATVSKQSPYGVLPRLPCSIIACARSGAFKSVFIQWLILVGMRNCFEKVYVFSASVFLDPVWDPVKKYCETVLGQDESDPWAYDTFDQEALQRVIDNAGKVTDYLRRMGAKKRFHILIVVDDWADSPQVTRGKDG